MTIGFCIPGKFHRFDSISGWCKNGCGNREDGRAVTFYGKIVDPGPLYTQAELDAIGRMALSRNAARAGR